MQPSKPPTRRNRDRGPRRLRPRSETQRNTTPDEPPRAARLRLQSGMVAHRRRNPKSKPGFGRNRWSVCADRWGLRAALLFPSTWMVASRQRMLDPNRQPLRCRFWHRVGAAHNPVSAPSSTTVLSLGPAQGQSNVVGRPNVARALLRAESPPAAPPSAPQCKPDSVFATRSSAVLRDATRLAGSGIWPSK
jgi:hypothetical protein